MSGKNHKPNILFALSIIHNLGDPMAYTVSAGWGIPGFDSQWDQLVDWNVYSVNIERIDRLHAEASLPKEVSV